MLWNKLATKFELINQKDNQIVLHPIFNDILIDSINVFEFLAKDWYQIEWFQPVPLNSKEWISRWVYFSFFS